MNKTKPIYRTSRLSWRTALVWLAVAGCASAVPRAGEAVVVGVVGKVQTRVFAGSVHEGATIVKDLSEGLSIGEASELMTAKNGRACLLLSPGAVLCVAPETELTFRQLRVAADGLPKTEEDLVRRIYIDLHKGRILIHAGASTPSMDIRVRVAGGEVAAGGGTFVTAQTGEGQWAVICEESGVSITPVQGSGMALEQGKAAALTLMEDGRGEVKEDASLLDSPARKFEICNCFFEDLERFIHDPGGFDRPGLSEYIGAGGASEFIGSSDSVMDVSPSKLTVMKNPNRLVLTPGQPGTHTRWDNQRAWLWYENIGVVKGVNYIPRNAVNSTEMWMKDTFDPDLIDEELGWAQNAGYTTVRVQLQYAVWKADPDGFMKRLNQFVDLAAQHHLQVVPVLFDDKNFANSDPSVGPQPEPVPGKHNARWTPSPGAAAVKDRSVWPSLEEYVRSVMNEFKRDDRIVYWDLYNRTGDNGLREETLPLMEQTFNWARDVDPKQPLAVAAWTRPESAMTARMLEKSDIITFQSFESAGQVDAMLMLLKRYDRPVICSNWLMRQRDNNFEKILPLFSINRVGWFNQGLVNGKTQEWIQQDAYRLGSPEVWQHDIFAPNGSAYDSKEIQLIQEFRFQDGF